MFNILFLISAIIFVVIDFVYLNLIKKEKFERNQIICIFYENKFVGMYKVVNEDDIFSKPEFVFSPEKV